MSEAESISWRVTNGQTDYVVGALGYIGSKGDEDWYKIYLTSGFYSLTLTNNYISRNSIFGLLPADYDIKVYNSAGTQIASSTKAGTATEQTHFTISSSGTYYIKIYGYLDAYSTSVQYKMMLTKGDTPFYMEGQRYRLFPHPFYGRLDSGKEYHAQGIAYSYGSKDSISGYESKMNQADANKKTPQTNWSDYSSSYPRPGRWKSEYDNGDKGQANWAGIDCSGLIWRAAAASDIAYKIEDSSILDVGTTQIHNNSTSITYSNAKIGDIYVKSGDHVAFISRLAPDERYTYVIHAASLTTGRKTQETLRTDIANYADYSRRALNK